VRAAEATGRSEIFDLEGRKRCGIRCQNRPWFVVRGCHSKQQMSMSGKPLSDILTILVRRGSPKWGQEGRKGEWGAYNSLHTHGNLSRDSLKTGRPSRGLPGRFRPGRLGLMTRRHVGSSTCRRNVAAKPRRTARPTSRRLRRLPTAGHGDAPLSSGIISVNWSANVWAMCRIEL